MTGRPFVSGLAAIVAGIGLGNAEPTTYETWANVETAGAPRWHGKLEARGGKLTMTESGGQVRAIDLEAVNLIEFNIPRRTWESQGFGSGEMPPPWKTALVGELPRGGETQLKSGKVIVYTTSPGKDVDFDSFSMVYRPLPEGDAQITTYIAQLDSYEEDTRCGLMLRDGVGIDARNVFLSASHREPAKMRHWKRRGGTTIVDKRRDIRPGSWLRLVRAGGKITGYVSRDSGFWREIASFDDSFENPVYACLVTQGNRPRRRWSATFANIDVTTMALLGGVRRIQPKITLVDGTVFHSEIASATPKLLRLGGADEARVVPVVSVARIEFYRPISHDQKAHLEGKRQGLLLADGDFLESKFGGIEDGVLTSHSALFGNREFELESEIDALVLRPAKDEPPAVLPVRLDTWAGGKLTGKSLRIEGDKIVLESLRLSARSFDLADIHRITRERS